MLAIRSAWASFDVDPFLHGSEKAITFESDGLLLIEGGRIVACGSFSELQGRIPPGTEVRHYKDALVVPGFIDTHVHYPQVQMIGAYGRQLLDWLNNYTFVSEQQFQSMTHAQQAARVFMRESVRAGTTTSMVYGTVHPQSVEALFAEALQWNVRLIAGKVLMDRNAPGELLESAQDGYDRSKHLIEKWQGQGRLSYAITPRFAPTSSPAQLELAGSLWQEHPDAYMQTHISENQEEVEWVHRLFPERKNYLDVYEFYGLLGRRSVLGHAIYLEEEEWQRCYDCGASVAHCPTSNEFLGSGLFSFVKAKQPSRPVFLGLATDLGAGTSFSMLSTMSSAYKIGQLSGYSLSAAHAFYLATKGGAQALALEDKVGAIQPGLEADLVVLNLRSTPLIDYRMNFCKSLEEVLFVQMTLADERAVQEVYIAGQSVPGAKLESPDLQASGLPFTV